MGRSRSVLRRTPKIRFRRQTPSPTPEDEDLRLIFNYCEEKPGFNWLILSGSNERVIREKIKRHFAVLTFENVAECFGRHDRYIHVNNIMIYNNDKDIFRFIEALGALGVVVDHVDFLGEGASMYLAERIWNALERHCAFKPRLLRLGPMRVNGELFVTPQLWNIMIEQRKAITAGCWESPVVYEWMVGVENESVSVPSHEPADLLNDVISFNRARSLIIYNYMSGTEARMVFPSYTLSDKVRRRDWPQMPLFYSQLFETHPKLQTIRVYAHREVPGKPYQTLPCVNHRNEHSYNQTAVFHYYQDELDVMEVLEAPPEIGSHRSDTSDSSRRSNRSPVHPNSRASSPGRSSDGSRNREPSRSPVRPILRPLESPEREPEQREPEQREPEQREPEQREPEPEENEQEEPMMVDLELEESEMEEPAQQQEEHRQERPDQEEPEEPEPVQEPEAEEPELEEQEPILEEPELEEQQEPEQVEQEQVHEPEYDSAEKNEQLQNPEEQEPELDEQELQELNPVEQQEPMLVEPEQEPANVAPALLRQPVLEAPVQMCKPIPDYLHRLLTPEMLRLLGREAPVQVPEPEYDSAEKNEQLQNPGEPEPELEEQQPGEQELQGQEQEPKDQELQQLRPVQMCKPIPDYLHRLLTPEMLRHLVLHAPVQVAEPEYDSAEKNEQLQNPGEQEPELEEQEPKDQELQLQRPIPDYLHRLVTPEMLRLLVPVQVQVPEPAYQAAPQLAPFGSLPYDWGEWSLVPPKIPPPIPPLPTGNGLLLANDPGPSPQEFVDRGEIIAALIRQLSDPPLVSYIPPSQQIPRLEPVPEAPTSLSTAKRPEPYGTLIGNVWIPDFAVPEPSGCQRSSSSSSDSEDVPDCDGSRRKRKRKCKEDEPLMKVTRNDE